MLTGCNLEGNEQKSLNNWLCKTGGVAGETVYNNTTNRNITTLASSIVNLLFLLLWVAVGTDQQQYSLPKQS